MTPSSFVNELVRSCFDDSAVPLRLFIHLAAEGLGRNPANAPILFRYVVDQDAHAVFWCSKRLDERLRHLLDRGAPLLFATAFQDVDLGDCHAASRTRIKRSASTQCLGPGNAPRRC